MIAYHVQNYQRIIYPLSRKDQNQFDIIASFVFKSSLKKVLPSLVRVYVCVYIYIYIVCVCVQNYVTMSIIQTHLRVIY